MPAQRDPKKFRFDQPIVYKLIHDSPNFLPAPIRKPKAHDPIDRKINKVFRDFSGKTKGNHQFEPGKLNCVRDDETLDIPTTIFDIETGLSCF